MTHNASLSRSHAEGVDVGLCTETTMDFLRDDSDRLLPCPFCGGDAEIDRVGGDPADINFGGMFVQCQNPTCQASTALIYPCGDDPKPLLLERWNRRHNAQIEPTPLAAVGSNAGLGADTVWEIHYHDGKASGVTRFIAHCRDCAWRRFEQQNRGCRVLVVMPVPNTALSGGEAVALNAGLEP